MEKSEKFHEFVPVCSPPPYASLTETISVQPVQRVVPVHQDNDALQGLISTDIVKFKQKIQIIQIICGCDMPIVFELVNDQDQIIFEIEEQEDCLMRNCVPQGFRTRAQVRKTNGLLALQLKREARCVFNCCMPCCCYPLPFSKECMTVLNATGVVLGMVRQDFSAWRSRFSILNNTGDVVLKIEGPGCNFSCCGDVLFKIVALSGEQIGSITKHDTGLLCETLADFDNFTLQFPRDMHVDMKATLVGAVKLINFLFFQGSLRRLALGCCLIGTNNVARVAGN